MLVRQTSRPLPRTEGLIELCSRLVRAVLSSVAPILSRELRSSPFRASGEGVSTAAEEAVAVKSSGVVSAQLASSGEHQRQIHHSRRGHWFCGSAFSSSVLRLAFYPLAAAVLSIPESGPSDSGRRDALRCHLGLAVPAVAEGVPVERQLLFCQAFHTTTDNPGSRNTLMLIGSASSSTGCAAMLDWEIGNTLKETADQERQSPRGTQLPAPL